AVRTNPSPRTSSPDIRDLVRERRRMRLPHRTRTRHRSSETVSPCSAARWWFSLQSPRSTRADATTSSWLTAGKRFCEREWTSEGCDRRGRAHADPPSKGPCVCLRQDLHDDAAVLGATVALVVRRHGLLFAVGDHVHLVERNLVLLIQITLHGFRALHADALVDLR